MDMYDVIIVGSGPAGLTAAIYATRANLKTLIIAGITWGGQLMLTTEVENYPGFPEGIQGPDLMMAMRKQAERFRAEIVEANMDPADFTTQSGGPFTITAGGKEYKGRVLLIASGADSKKLEVPGEDRLAGHGVSYCATCDGAFFRNKNIIVVGGGDSAMEEALFLTRFAQKVTLIHRRDTFRASQIMQDRVKQNSKIELLLSSQIVEILGENKVEKVKIKSPLSVIPNSFRDLPENHEILNQVQNDKEVVWKMLIEGIFIAVGHVPNSSVFKGVELKDNGYVRAQDGTRTNIEGIFVSGDVEDDHYRQAVTAAGFGCMAALDIERYLRDKAM